METQSSLNDSFLLDLTNTKEPNLLPFNLLLMHQNKLFNRHVE